MNTRHRN